MVTNELVKAFKIIIFMRIGERFDWNVHIATPTLFIFFLLAFLTMDDFPFIFYSFFILL